MATKEELFKLVQSGNATASDYEELAKVLKVEATEKKKVEDQAKDLIDSIKKANIDPKVLTNLLAKEGLIQLPNEPEKIVILEESVRTAKGRESVFKLWIGRDVKALTGDAKKYWDALKAKGKDYFEKNLNADGNAYKQTEEGKKWIEELFKPA